jgi:four helix bundle protein
MRKEIEKRLVVFAGLIVEVCKNLDGSNASECLTNQIIRSGTSAALNYGEAQGAESKNDFIHKTSIVLKELRETNINLQIISTNKLSKNFNLIEKALDESDQLVAIFQKTVMTARNRR